MPMDDLVFVDDQYKLCGWLAGTDEETEREWLNRYKVWTYGHFYRFWKDRENIAESAKA